MKRANEEIRRMMGANGIKQWQIASYLGIREETLSRKLRTELSEDLRQKVNEAIEAIASEEDL
jgi:hypothetical protein